jgi:sarcosine oxidase, subunit gamma
MSELMQEPLPEVNEQVRCESPLHYCVRSGDVRGRASELQRSNEAGVVLCEQALMGHLNLRGNPDNVLFRKGVEDVLGVKLPLYPGICASLGETRLCWLAPNEWLVMVAGGREVDVELRLREVLQGHFSVVDISGGQTLINLSGESVLMVLKKSSVYDFHPSRFGVGRCVQTTFAKATALVSRNSNSSFDLVIRRSFADYIFQWIADAADEYGFTVRR